MVDATEIKDYSCGKCRKKLFSSESLVTHTSKKKAYNVRGTKGATEGPVQACTSFYLEIQQWMNLPEDL